MECIECNAHLGFQLLDLVLALEVPDLDGGAGGRAQPVQYRFGEKHSKLMVSKSTAS